MADKIKKDDLFDDSFFEDYQKGVFKNIDVTKELIEVNEGLRLLLSQLRKEDSKNQLKTYKDLQARIKIDKQVAGILTQIAGNEKKITKIREEQSKATDKVKKSTDDATTAQIKNNKAQEAGLKVQNQKLKNDLQELKLEQAIKKAYDDEAKALSKTNQEAAKAAALAAKQAQEQAKANSLYNQASAKLNDLRKRYKELAIAGRENGKVGRGLKDEITALDKKLKDIDGSVGQFTRHVGDYRGAITDALKDTGLFNNGLGRLISTLKAVRDSQDKTATGAKALGNAFKLTGVGLVLAALAALKAAFDVAEEFTASVAEAAEIATASLKGLTLGGFEGAIAFKNYTVELIAFRKELLKLQESLQQTALDEEDFNEIANDATIGFKQRNAALERAIALGNERAKQEVTIAQKQFDIVEAEIAAIQKANGGREVSIQFLQKQSEAVQNLRAAQDRQADLERQDAQRRREQAVKQTVAEIELLRSNKLSAKARQQILEQEIADQKNQLEERKRDAKELILLNRQTTAEQIKIFKQGIGVQFDETQLLKTEDAKLLKQRLESIKTLAGNGLGEEALGELAKIIKQAQENEIANNKIIKDQEDEEIKRAQKIAELKREVAIIEGDAALGEAEKLLDEQVRLYEDANNKILENDNVFNDKLLKQRELAFELQKSQLISVTELKREQLKQQFLLDSDNLTNTITDQKILDEERKKLAAKFNADLNALNLDEALKEKEIARKKLEEEKNIRAKQREVIVGYINKSLDLISEELQKESQARQEALDKDIDRRQANIERQQALAERGLNNTIAFEEAQLAKQELAREQEKNKEVKRQKAISFLRLLAGYAEKDPATALSKALIDIALAEVIQGAFKDGVENLQGPGTSTSDSIPVLLSRGESVAKATATANDPGLVTAMNNGTIADYTRDVLLPKYVLNHDLGSGDTGTNMANSALLMQLVYANNRLDALTKVIANKRETTVNLEKTGDMILTDVENGIKTVTRYKRRKPRL